MVKNDHLHIRINPTLKDRLKDAAAKENRTVSNYIKNLLSETLKEENEMKYSVEVNFEGTAIKTIGDLSKAEAIAKAKEEATDEEVRVFISWHRASDQQRGYLNPDGDHAINGIAW